MKPPKTAPSPRQGTAPASVDQYVQAFPPEIRSVLLAVRRTVLDAVPGGEERISYRMPEANETKVSATRRASRRS